MMVVSSASVVCRHTIFVYFSTTGIDALVKGQGRCDVFLGVLCSRDIVREQNICAWFIEKRHVSVGRIRMHEYI